MKIKILLLSTHPKNTAVLRLDEEFREIKEGLALAEHGDCFQLIQAGAVRPKDLRRLVLKEKPHIIHFSGHGSEAGIYLEDETAQAQVISGESLAGLFRHFDSVQLVILNACDSETQAQALSKVTPYVIAMNSPINDQAAIAFSSGFYDALGANPSFNAKAIQRAFEIGVNAITMMGNSQTSRSLELDSDAKNAKNDNRAQVKIPVLLKSDIQRSLPKQSAFFWGYLSDKRLSRWAAYATILAIPIALMGLFMASSSDNSINPSANNKPASIQQLKSAGTILNKKGELLVDVMITIPELHLKTRSDTLGHFQFSSITSKKSVRIYATKKGYQAWNDEIRLGDQDYRFLLLRE